MSRGKRIDQKGFYYLEQRLEEYAEGKNVDLKINPECKIKFQFKEIICMEYLGGIFSYKERNYW